MTSNDSNFLHSELNDSHTSFMESALNLAIRGLGNVWPNPAVGCVIVKENKVVGRGWTRPGGRPHAETEALRRAGSLAEGAVAYITLEPCNHHGETPPCTDALISAGIKKVVIATADPDERVNGSGILRLKEAGIEVLTGIAEGKSIEVNKGFFSKIKRSRPYITLKIASSLDGKIAIKSGESKWITGDSARRKAHQLRQLHDATMVGSGTVLADDPLLTSRILGVSNSNKLRIILDGRLRMPLNSNLVKTASEVPLLVLTYSKSNSAKLKIKKLTDHGVGIHICNRCETKIEIKEVMNILNSQGITRLLVEGGGQLATSLLKADLVDEIAWFRAPSIIGNDGVAAIDLLGFDRFEKIHRFKRRSLIELGSDYLEILTRTER